MILYIRSLAMTSMSVSLPDQMRGFIKSRVEAGEYHNESEYIRDLIRQDQKKLSAEAALLKALKEAEAGSISDRQLPQIMKAVKERLKTNGQL